MLKDDSQQHQDFVHMQKDGQQKQKETTLMLKVMTPYPQAHTPMQKDGAQ